MCCETWRFESSREHPFRDYNFMRLTVLLLLSATQLLAAPLTFWTDPKVEGESLFFIQTENTAAKAALLRTPSELPSLRSANRDVTYELDRDFIWKAGSREITLTANSRIPFKKTAELHPAPGSPNSYDGLRDSTLHMLYSQGRFFHDLQCEATYPTTESWPGPVPAAAPAEQLSHVRARLAAKQPVKIVMLGDSISTGLNASLTGQAPPLQPGYPDLVAKALGERSGAAVTLKNLSVGGMDSRWGLGQMDAVLAETPDLFLCAFGMNDASGHAAPAAFAATIQQMLQRLHAARPECDAILLSPMTANAEWKHAAPDLYPAYATALQQLAAPGCAIADVTSVWLAIMQRKTHLDLSGNGLNHPNDFGHRLYAEIVLATIGELAKP